MDQRVATEYLDLKGRLSAVAAGRIDLPSIAEPARWIGSLLGAVQEYRRLRGQMVQAVEAADQAVKAHTEYLATLREQPAPLLGSREAKELARDVEATEAQIDAARAEQSEVRRVVGDDMSVDVSVALQHAAPTVLAPILSRVASLAQDRMAELVSDRALKAGEVLRVGDDYAAVVGFATEIAGGSMTSPRLVLPHEEAWRTVARGALPTLETSRR